MVNNKSNTLSYMITNSIKNPKNIFKYIFNAVTRVRDSSNGAQDNYLWQLFLSRLFLFDYIFSGIVWIEGAWIDEGIYVSDNDYHGNEKKQHFF